jgi:hypothetical protein
VGRQNGAIGRYDHRRTANGTATTSDFFFGFLAAYDLRFVEVLEL